MRTTETASLVCALAEPGDAADIAALLRDNPMDGAYSIALTRDPDPFMADGALRHAFIIARDKASGAAVGLCERSVRECFVDGEPRLLPYLGALRVARGHRGRIGVLRAGFRLLRQCVELPDEAPFALTSIADGNAAAERVLTAGLPGLPIYRRLGGYATFALRPRAARRADNVVPARREDLPALAAFLNERNRSVQFAPVWSDARLAALANHGLPPARILLRRAGGEIIGCVALWDQRAARQTRVMRYPTLLGALRPLTNLAAPLTGLPSLPPRGAALAQATAALCAARDDDAAIFESLLVAALATARAAGFSVLAIGFASEHPWRAALLSRRRALEYRSTLYVAHWPEAPPDCNMSPARLGPELAFL